MMLEHGVLRNDLALVRESRAGLGVPGCGTAGHDPATSGTSTRSFLTIDGEQRYLWCAVDQHGNVLDVLVHAQAQCQLPGDLPGTAQGPAIRAAGASPIRPASYTSRIATCSARSIVDDPRTEQSSENSH
ncbi:hypothetical protein H0B43_01380 [Rhodococcus wratislaviensis]|nr:hypothetical protein [Rhodococcus sp. 4CII]